MKTRSQQKMDNTTSKNTTGGSFDRNGRKKTQDQADLKNAKSGRNSMDKESMPPRDDKEWHCSSTVAKQHKKSKFKRFKTTNCFERNREKGGGVDESEGDGDDDEEEEQVEIKDLDSQHYEANENQLQMAICEQRPLEKKTIRDIINNNRTGIPAKSMILSNQNKRLDKDSKSDKAQNEVVMQDGLKLDIMKESTPAIQPEINPSVPIHKRIIIVNGKPQIDQSSLMVEKSQIRKEEDDPKYFKVINENSDALTMSAIYAKRSHTKKWTHDETEFFYQCLTECGTDFSMIESKFNGKRNRTQIKNKYRKEENENPERIEEAVFSRRVIPINKRDSKQKSKESSELDNEFEGSRSQ